MVVDGNTYAANVGIASGAAFTATINKDSGTNTCAYDTRFANVCQNQEQYSIILNGSNGNPIIYSWQILNPSSGGNFSFSLSGVVLTSAGNPVVLYNRASAGIETCTLKCTISQSGNPTLEVSLNIVRTHNQQTATATLTPVQSSYNEGDSVSLTVETTGVPNGTILYVVPDAGNTVNWSPVDFDDQTTDFWVYIYNNQGIITRVLRQDAITEGTEKLKLKLVTQPGGTDQVGTTSPEITINDTSTSSAPDIFSVSVSPNPLTAVAGGFVPWTISVNLTRAVTAATGVDIELIGSNGYDTTYTNLITIPANSSTGSFTNSTGVGDSQGDRNVTIVAKKPGVFASSRSTIWDFNPPATTTGGKMVVTNSGYWNYSGNLTSSSPLTGTSTNAGVDSSMAFINFIIQDKGGTVYYNISSDSEATYDIVQLIRNGVDISTRSGSNKNMNGSFTVAVGNTVVVKYTKDGSVDSGSDSATINSLYFVSS